MIDIKIVRASVLEIETALRRYTEKGYVPVGGISLTGRSVSSAKESCHQPEAMVMMVCEVVDNVYGD